MPINRMNLWGHLSRLLVSFTLSVYTLTAFPQVPILDGIVKGAKEAIEILKSGVSNEREGDESLSSPTSPKNNDREASIEAKSADAKADSLPNSNAGTSDDSSPVGTLKPDRVPLRDVEIEVGLSKLNADPEFRKLDLRKFWGSFEGLWAERAYEDGKCLAERSLVHFKPEDDSAFVLDVFRRTTEGALESVANKIVAVYEAGNSQYWLIIGEPGNRKTRFVSINVTTLNRNHRLEFLFGSFQERYSDLIDRYTDFVSIYDATQGLTYKAAHKCDAFTTADKVKSGVSSSKNNLLTNHNNRIVQSVLSELNNKRVEKPQNSKSDQLEKVVENNLIQSYVNQRFVQACFNIRKSYQVKYVEEEDVTSVNAALRVIERESKSIVDSLNTSKAKGDAESLYKSSLGGLIEISKLGPHVYQEDLKLLCYGAVKGVTGQLKLDGKFMPPKVPPEQSDKQESLSVSTTNNCVHSLSGTLCFHPTLTKLIFSSHTFDILGHSLQDSLATLDSFKCHMMLGEKKSSRNFLRFQQATIYCTNSEASLSFNYIIDWQIKYYYLRTLDYQTCAPDRVIQNSDLHRSLLKKYGEGKITQKDNLPNEISRIEFLSPQSDDRLVVRFQEQSNIGFTCGSRQVMDMVLTNKPSRDFLEKEVNPLLELQFDLDKSGHIQPKF